MTRSELDQLIDEPYLYANLLGFDLITPFHNDWISKLAWRDEDYTLQDSERLQVARENSVDLLLLLHAQAGLSAEQEGIHLYVRTNPEMDSPTSFSQGSSMALALRLKRALREAGFKVHAVSSTTLLPLPRSEIPIVLVELGYLSNAHDVENLTDAVQRQSLAAALLKGVQDFHQNLETM